MSRGCEQYLFVTDYNLVQSLKRLLTKVHVASNVSTPLSGRDVPIEKIHKLNLNST